VSSDGTEIPGSRVGPGAAQPNCATQILGPCKGANSANPPPPGAYVPQCDANGNFVPLQLHGSTGNSWCVSSDGTEIPGTRVGPGVPSPNCVTQSISGPCKGANSANPPPPGAYVPQCDAIGNFLPLQLHGSTGNSWCVTVDGTEIPGTRTGPGVPSANCAGKQVTTRDCRKEAANTNPLPGSFIPQCDANGNYQPLQQHGSTGNSWCVTLDGTEIAGTRVGPSGPPPNCATSKQGPCKPPNSANPPPPGAYVPQCDANGNFVPLQLYGSTGYSWCVSTDGTEIPGTRVGPSAPSPNCATVVAKVG